MSGLEQVRQWAQSQIDNTAQPEVRADIAVTVLQMIEQLEEQEESLQHNSATGYSLRRTRPQVPEANY